MTGDVFSGSGGKKYTIAQRIGGGGEGEVYTVSENSGLVIKLYKEALDRDKAEKLVHMTALASEELLRFTAWPVDTARDPTGRLRGFVMRRLEGYAPLHMLFTPMDRKRLFPDKGYSFLVHVARNLAVAFHKIHQLGIIVGDVNEGNVLVTGSGMVALIDCDSFQVRNGPRYHFCEVGMPRYTPPELLRRGSFDQVIRTAGTDAFSLATLIFQLLFLGRAPFTGYNPGTAEIDEIQAIKEGEFAYSLRRQGKRLFPARNSLPLTVMPTAIIKAFHEAFEQEGQRPLPLSWVEALSDLNKSLVTCQSSTLHQFPTGASTCPWCAFREQANIHYFLDDAYLQAAPELNDIDRFVNGFRLEPLQLTPLSASYQRAGAKARPVPAEFRRWKQFNRVMAGLIVLLTIAGCFINIAALGVGIVVSLLFNGLSPTRRKLKKELAERQDRFQRLKTSFDSLVRSATRSAEQDRYQETAKKFQQTIDTFRGLPGVLTRLKKEIEEKHYQNNYLQYLRQFDIRNYQIVQFGPAKKQLLFQHGIRTAADIGRIKQIRISGIGPKNEQILMDWQRHIGSGFAYRPDQLAIGREQGQAQQTILQRKSSLENDIRQGYRTLNGLRANVLSSARVLAQKHAELAPKVHQAELDLEYFKKFMK